MKKSQILAALALAFALGVVAPVTGAINSASAVTITEDGVVATKKDLTDTIAAIEAQGEYQNYKALSDALAMTATDLSDGTAATAIINAVKALDANDDFGYANYAGPTFAANTTYTEAQKLQMTLDEAEAAISKISGKSYDLWNNLYVAMTKNATNDPDHSDNQRAQAILDAATALGMNVAAYDASTDSLATVQGAINGTSYNTYASILANIATDQATIDKINDKIAALKSALAPFANATAIADAAATATPITSLSALQSTATRKSSYDTLIATITADKANLANASFTGYDTTTGVLAAVNALKSQYKAAAGSDLNVPTDPSQPGANVKTFTTEDGKVSVTGEFPASVVKLYVAPMNDKKVPAFGAHKAAIYDIELRDADDKKVEFNGTAVVTIEVPGNFNWGTSAVYYINDNDEVEQISAEYNGGYFTFTTNHFSLYAIVDFDNGVSTDDGEGKGDANTPNTGIIATADGNATSTASIMAGIATALTAAGVGVVAFRNIRRNKKA